MMDEHIKARKTMESYNKIRKHSLWKGCFFQDADCSNRIIHAHSVQNNRILNKISHEGRVLQFGVELGSIPTAKMKNEGRNKATTFTGFCSYHDTKIFSPIENFDYVKGNKEQEFLFAYRALAKEYHAKQSCLKMTEKIINYIEEGRYWEINQLFKDDPPSYSQLKILYETMDYQNLGFATALNEYEQYNKSMRINIKNGKFHSVITDTVVFDEEYHLATSSLINIVTDLDGKIINNLSSLDTYLSPLFITVFPQKNKTYILMSYFRRDKERYKFLQAIDKMSENEKKITISNILVKYVENIAFSPIRWMSLDETTQKKISNYFLETTLNKEKKLVTKNINIFI